MQNAKDTFYLTLQQRLAALNPARTLVLRGQLRPGTLVEENETAATQPPADTFRLAWTALSLDCSCALPLATLQCEIRYATDGTAANVGMDRGRAALRDGCRTRQRSRGAATLRAQARLHGDGLRLRSRAYGHQHLLGRAGLRCAAVHC